jgi:hypothetical protein
MCRGNSPTYNVFFHRNSTLVLGLHEHRRRIFDKSYKSHCSLCQYFLPVALSFWVRKETASFYEFRFNLLLQFQYGVYLCCFPSIGLLLLLIFVTYSMAKLGISCDTGFGLDVNIELHFSVDTTFQPVPKSTCQSIPPFWRLCVGYGVKGLTHAFRACSCMHADYVN